jgi:C_GCAxxG_C_C family probable redox protein
MADVMALKAKVKELAERKWDLHAIRVRYRNLKTKGIPVKRLHKDEMAAKREEILQRIQRRGEEYNFLAQNCAVSTVLSIMEEFGLGTMDLLRAFSPFPGYGGTGWMCGGVTGGLAGLGLYFGSADIEDYYAAGRSIMAASEFVSRFEKETGSVLCPQLQEKVVFGKYMDPAAGEENMKTFTKAKGFEKCGIFPGIGARIAAEIILESLV